jgi:hypothetical protein
MKRHTFGLEKEIPDKHCPLTLKEDYKHALFSRSDLTSLCWDKEQTDISTKRTVVSWNKPNIIPVRSRCICLKFEEQGNANAFLPSKISLEIRKLPLTFKNRESYI